MDKSTIVLLAVGAASFAGGVISLSRTKKRDRRCTVSGKARIADVIVERDSDSRGRDYTPVFEFAFGGRVIRKTGGVYSSNRRKYTVGDIVDIRVDPNDPEVFVVEGQTTKSSRSFGVALIIMSVIFVSIGLWLQFGQK